MQKRNTMELISKEAAVYRMKEAAGVSTCIYFMVLEGVL